MTIVTMATMVTSDHCYHSNANTLSQQVPVLPDVTFKDLPFYEELDVLIKPTSLVDHGPGR